MHLHRPLPYHTKHIPYSTTYLRAGGVVGDLVRIDLRGRYVRTPERWALSLSGSMMEGSWACGVGLLCVIVVFKMWFLASLQHTHTVEDRTPAGQMLRVSGTAALPKRHFTHACAMTYASTPRHALMQHVWSHSAVSHAAGYAMLPNVRARV